VREHTFQSKSGRKEEVSVEEVADEKSFQVTIKEEKYDERMFRFSLAIVLYIRVFPYE
jgi:hypothetical protein